MTVIIVDPFNYFNYSYKVSEQSKLKSAQRLNSLLFNSIRFKNNPTPNIIIGDSRIKRLPTKEIKEIIPDCSISQDIISGFPNETDKDHNLTLDLMNKVKYDFGYMFKYSERPGTLASKKFNDNISELTKKNRLQEIVDLQQKHSNYRTKGYVGKIVEVLIEKESKKSRFQWSGRNQQNTVVVFDKENYQIGDFVNVLITDCTSATLIGNAVNYSKNSTNGIIYSNN